MNVQLLKSTSGGRRYLDRRAQAATGERTYLKKIVQEAKIRQKKSRNLL